MPEPTRYTFAQVRAKLANTALATYTTRGLITELEALGVVVSHPVKSPRALALKLAWALLPGGNEKVRHTSAAAD